MVTTKRYDVKENGARNPGRKPRQRQAEGWRCSSVVEHLPRAHKVHPELHTPSVLTHV